MQFGDKCSNLFMARYDKALENLAISENAPINWFLGSILSKAAKENRSPRAVVVCMARRSKSRKLGHQQAIPKASVSECEWDTEEGSGVRLSYSAYWPKVITPKAPLP